MGVKSILAENASVKLHLISKVNSLTNVQEVVSQENFKPPKTMKDMEKLFSNLYPKDEDGFYSNDTHLENPEKSKQI